MPKGNPQVDRLVQQHNDQLLKEKIKEEQRKKKGERRSPFEGSCTSMNKNESHPKSYRKTQRALMKV